MMWEDSDDSHTKFMMLKWWIVIDLWKMCYFLGKFFFCRMVTNKLVVMGNIFCFSFGGDKWWSIMSRNMKFRAQRDHKMYL
jgi:hypothetical protein